MSPTPSPTCSLRSPFINGAHHGACYPPLLPHAPLLSFYKMGPTNNQPMYPPPRSLDVPSRVQGYYLGYPWELLGSASVEHVDSWCCPFGIFIRVRSISSEYFYPCAEFHRLSLQTVDLPMCRLPHARPSPYADLPMHTSYICPCPAESQEISRKKSDNNV